MLLHAMLRIGLLLGELHICLQDRLTAKHELLCHVESAQAELSAKLQAAEEQVQASNARLAQSQVGPSLHTGRPLQC